MVYSNKQAPALGHQHYSNFKPGRYYSVSLVPQDENDRQKTCTTITINKNNNIKKIARMKICKIQSQSKSS